MIARHYIPRDRLKSRYLVDDQVTLSQVTCLASVLTLTLSAKLKLGLLRGDHTGFSVTSFGIVDINSENSQ